MIDIIMLLSKGSLLKYTKNDTSNIPLRHSTRLKNGDNTYFSYVEGAIRERNIGPISLILTIVRKHLSNKTGNGCDKVVRVSAHLHCKCTKQASIPTGNVYLIMSIEQYNCFLVLCSIR